MDRAAIHEFLEQDGVRVIIDPNSVDERVVNDGHVAVILCVDKLPKSVHVHSTEAVVDVD
jgi:hypothetical protein